MLPPLINGEVRTCFGVYVQASRRIVRQTDREQDRTKHGIGDFEATYTGSQGW